jgi:hypothetical protein
MNNLFISLLFAHIIGDYFLQNTYLAMNKSASSFKCAIHCTLYTLSICCFTTFHWPWILFVFGSHFVVDRFNLADSYLKLINSRSLKNFYHFGHKNIPLSTVNEKYGKPVQRLTIAEENLNYRILRGGFTSIVYVVVDNTIHFLSMYYLYFYFN